jgi:hypothetical protein
MIIQIQNGKMKILSGNTRQYDGEKIPGDLKAWDYLGTNPNEMLLWTYDILSQRATTLFHTHGPIGSACGKLNMYAIGSGLKYRSQPDWETLGMTRDKAKSWGMQFQKLVHYIFMLTNFYDKQPVLFNTSLVMGDGLLFFDRSVDDDLPFDLIEIGGDQINFKGASKNSGQECTLGILHDKAMRRQGVILNDGTEPTFKDENGDQNFVMFYNKQLARQLRGFPLAYKIIAAAKNNDRWWDATLARLVMETIILGTSKEMTSEDVLYNQSNELAKITKAEGGGSNPGNNETLEKISKVVELIPGSAYSYKGGGGMEFSDLKTPSNNFDKVQTAYIEVVGMATGVPAEVILSKYSTSYTAHKGAFNDFIKSFMMYRSKFINLVCVPVVLEIAKWAIMNRLIDMPNPDFFDNRIMQLAAIAGNYLGPVPGHINPAQEVAAKKEAVESAFDLRSNVATENGNEWDNFIEEWHQEETEFRKGNPEQQATTIQNDINQNVDQQADDNQNNNQNDNQDQGANQ